MLSHTLLRRGDCSLQGSMFWHQEHSDGSVDWRTTDNSACPQVASVLSAWLKKYVLVFTANHSFINQSIHVDPG